MLLVTELAVLPYAGALPPDQLPPCLPSSLTLPPSYFSLAVTDTGAKAWQALLLDLLGDSLALVAPLKCLLGRAIPKSVQRIVYYQQMSR